MSSLPLIPPLTHPLTSLTGGRASSRPIRCLSGARVGRVMGVCGGRRGDRGGGGVAAGAYPHYHPPPHLILLQPLPTATHTPHLTISFLPFLKPPPVLSLSFSPPLSSPPSQVVVRRLDQSDAFLVLGSDGLWEYVGDDEAIGVVVAAGSIEVGVKALLALAKERWLTRDGAGYVDDITALVVGFTHRKV
ncbi:unnamed protein product [Closterium sp. NIES-54]